MVAKEGHGKALSNLLLAAFSVFSLLPILLLISISISTQSDLVEFGYRLIPKKVTLLAYRVLLQDAGRVLRAYYISVTSTAIGTLLSLILNSAIAYPLSRSDFGYRKVITFAVFFTMLFNAGLVPSYIMIARVLQLSDTFLVLFLPMAVVPWFVLLFRTFMGSIPHSVIESAILDGAHEVTIYLRIIVPLSRPAFATIGLFSMLQYWNDWFIPMLYIQDQRLVNIQALLQRNLQAIEFLRNNAMRMPNAREVLENMPTESARMALAVIVILPIAAAFPIFQRHFVKGLTVGAIKA